MNRHTRSHRRVIAIGLTGLVLGLMPPAGAPPAVADESIQTPRGRETDCPRGEDTERPQSEDTERPRGEDPAAPRGD
jgi:hypothetical protein